MLASSTLQTIVLSSRIAEAEKFYSDILGLLNGKSRGALIYDVGGSDLQVSPVPETQPTGHLVIATMHSASCAEALTRICMSFPAEIQGGIRAQVADCFVGVGQRLEFLPDFLPRVPVCEILLPSAASKGTIRGGQFSQIANVLQTGGEAGMWNFDRYQGWVAQKKDWVQPTLAAPLPEERLVPAPLKIQRPTNTPIVAKDDSLEILIDEEVDLDELAKRIEQRTPRA